MHEQMHERMIYRVSAFYIFHSLSLTNGTDVTITNSWLKVD